MVATENFSSNSRLQITVSVRIHPAAILSVSCTLCILEQSVRDGRACDVPQLKQKKLLHVVGFQSTQSKRHNQIVTL